MISNLHTAAHNSPVPEDSVKSLDHILDIYSDDNALLNRLGAYITEGLLNGEAVVNIATKEHSSLLASYFTDIGFDINLYKQSGKYFQLDAVETLEMFMVDGWPSEKLFNYTIESVLYKTGYPVTTVRAFGEMVAILWKNGDHAATVQLEELWNRFCSQHNLQLYCAYHRNSFQHELASSLQHICHAHTSIIGVDEKTGLIAKA